MGKMVFNRKTGRVTESSESIKKPERKPEDYFDKIRTTLIQKNMILAQKDLKKKPAPLPKKAVPPKPDLYNDVFLPQVFALIAKDPALGRKDAERILLNKNPKLAEIAHPRTRSGDNPYLREFYQRVETLMDDEPTLQPGAAKATIRRQYPHLATAAFAQDPHKRFIAGVEVEIERDPKIDLAEGYKRAGRMLPDEGRKMELGV